MSRPPSLVSFQNGIKRITHPDIPPRRRCPVRSSSWLNQGALAQMTIPSPRKRGIIAEHVRVPGLEPSGHPPAPFAPLPLQVQTSAPQLNHPQSATLQRFCRPFNPKSKAVSRSDKLVCRSRSRYGAREEWELNRYRPLAENTECASNEKVRPIPPTDVPPINPPPVARRPADQLENCRQPRDDFHTTQHSFPDYGYGPEPFLSWGIGADCWGKRSKDSIEGAVKMPSLLNKVVRCDQGFCEAPFSNCLAK